MSTVDFTQLLNKKVTEAERPKPLPEGHYVGQITAQPEVGQARNEKETPYVRFQVQLQSAQEDVDQQALAEAVPDGNLQGKTFRSDYWLTDDALFRLRELIESCGVSTEGKSFGETIPQMFMQQVVVELTKTPSKDGQAWFNNIKSMRGASQA